MPICGKIDGLKKEIYFRETSWDFLVDRTKAKPNCMEKYIPERQKSNRIQMRMQSNTQIHNANRSWCKIPPTRTCSLAHEYAFHLQLSIAIRMFVMCKWFSVEWIWYHCRHVLVFLSISEWDWLDNSKKNQHGKSFVWNLLMIGSRSGLFWQWGPHAVQQLWKWAI